MINVAIMQKISTVFKNVSQGQTVLLQAGQITSGILADLTNGTRQTTGGGFTALYPDAAQPYIVVTLYLSAPKNISRVNVFSGLSNDDYSTVGNSSAPNTGSMYNNSGFSDVLLASVRFRNTNGDMIGTQQYALGEYRWSQIDFTEVPNVAYIEFEMNTEPRYVYFVGLEAWGNN